MAAVLALLLVQSSLVERLGAERPADRDEASRRLEALGAAALGALDAGTRHPDLEVASRSRALLGRLLSPRLLKEMPDAVPRAAVGDDRAFAELYLRILDTWADPPLDGADLAVAARPALRGARWVGEKRTAIAGAVGWKHASALPELRSLAADPSWEVRVSAAWALGELGGREEVPLLRRLLDEREPYVAAQAALSLADRGAIEELPRIHPLTRSRAPVLRKAAIRAAARLVPAARWARAAAAVPARGF